MAKSRSRRLPKPKKGAWFHPHHWSFLPCAWQGWALYVPYISYLILVLVVVERGSHTLADTLFSVFPYWVCGAVVMQWIAGHKS